MPRGLAGLLHLGHGLRGLDGRPLIDQGGFHLQFPGGGAPGANAVDVEAVVPDPYFGGEAVLAFGLIPGEFAFAHPASDGLKDSGPEDALQRFHLVADHGIERVPPVGVRETITNLCRAGFRPPVGVAAPAQEGLTGRFLMCSKVGPTFSPQSGSASPTQARRASSASTGRP